MAAEDRRNTKSN